MKQIASIFSMVLSLGTVGCQTTSTNPSATQATTSKSPPTSESTTVEEATQDQGEGQSTLSEDVQAVERQGQIFLESSFALYDRLLNENISEKDTDVARTAVEDCREKYNELVEAIAVLKTSLARTEVREALPLSNVGNKAELDELLTSLALYVPAEFSRDEYTVSEGKYLTAMMFPGLKEEIPGYFSSLPKANRDALLFLDHLKRISGDLSNVHSTLTAWIDDSSSFNAEAFVH